MPGLVLVIGGASGIGAASATFLLSDKASYITGEVPFTDGGWHGHA